MDLKFIHLYLHKWNQIIELKIITRFESLDILN